MLTFYIFLFQLLLVIHTLCSFKDKIIILKCRPTNLLTLERNTMPVQASAVCTKLYIIICEQLPRVSHALCPSKRGLYAFAGIDHVVLDGMDRELILDAVEFYDPLENRWRFVRQFPFGCYNTGSIVVDEK